MTPDKSDLPSVAYTRTGRVVAAMTDLIAVAGASAAVHRLLPLGWGASLAVGAVTYHTVSLVVLGSSPAVWAIESYLTHRHPTTTRAGRLRFPRLLPRSQGSQPS